MILTLLALSQMQSHTVSTPIHSDFRPLLSLTLPLPCPSPLTSLIPTDKNFAVLAKPVFMMYTDRDIFDRVYISMTLFPPWQFPRELQGPTPLIPNHTPLAPNPTTPIPDLAPLFPDLIPLVPIPTPLIISHRFDDRCQVPYYDPYIKLQKIYPGLNINVSL